MVGKHLIPLCVRIVRKKKPDKRDDARKRAGAHRIQVAASSTDSILRIGGGRCQRQFREKVRIELNPGFDPLQDVRPGIGVVGERVEKLGRDSFAEVKASDDSVQKWNEIVGRHESTAVQVDDQVNDLYASVLVQFAVLAHGSASQRSFSGNTLTTPPLRASPHSSNDRENCRIKALAASAISLEHNPSSVVM